MLGTGGFLRLDPAFAYAEASVLMTFAMGGVPHAGSLASVCLVYITLVILPPSDPYKMEEVCWR